MPGWNSGFNERPGKLNLQQQRPGERSVRLRESALHASAR